MSGQPTNLILRALSPESRDAILAQGKEMALDLRAVLQQQEETPGFVYFLLSGLASVVVRLPEGGSQETALIGNEGLTGTYSLLGYSPPPSTIFMQVEGKALRVPLPTMRELFQHSAEIRSLVLEQVQQLAMTTSQIAACNNAHDAEPRLARWLLMVQDRTGRASFQLTQEFLSEMLGARRTTVALAAGALQRSGFIEYARGKITILSREELQTAACDCYPITLRLLQKLYGSHTA